MTPAKLRLFIAVDPAPSAVDAVEDQVRPVKEGLTNARWAPIEKRHLTLKFLGTTDPALVDEVAQGVAAAARAHERAKVRFEGLGAFPSPRRARVVWAGVEDPAGLLPALAATLDETLAPLGFERAKRTYRPHLTLARLRAPANVASILQTAGDVASEPFSVDGLRLYRSKLHPSGATYELLGRFDIPPATGQN